MEEASRDGLLHLEQNATKYTDDEQDVGWKLPEGYGEMIDDLREGKEPDGTPWEEDTEEDGDGGSMTSIDSDGGTSSTARPSTIGVDCSCATPAAA